MSRVYKVKNFRTIQVLKMGGKFIILQPNIRFCFKDYWMFFDHITPLDDRSLSEILEINGFKVVECKPKFLPYTTKSKLPKSIFLIKLYLKFPLMWRIFGKQAFIYAKKCKWQRKPREVEKTYFRNVIIFKEILVPKTFVNGNNDKCLMCKSWSISKLLE